MTGNKVIDELLEGVEPRFNVYMMDKNDRSFYITTYYNYCVISDRTHIESVEISYDEDEETTQKLIDSLFTMKLVKDGYVIYVKANGNITIHPEVDIYTVVHKYGFKSKWANVMQPIEFVHKTIDVLKKIDFDPKDMNSLVDKYDSYMCSRTKNARN